MQPNGFVLCPARGARRQNSHADAQRHPSAWGCLSPSRRGRAGPSPPPCCVPSTMLWPLGPLPPGDQGLCEEQERRPRAAFRATLEDPSEVLVLCFLGQHFSQACPLPDRGWEGLSRLLRFLPALLSLGARALPRRPRASLPGLTALAPPPTPTACLSQTTSYSRATSLFWCICHAHCGHGIAGDGF